MIFEYSLLLEEGNMLEFIDLDVFSLVDRMDVIRLSEKKYTSRGADRVIS